MIDLGNRTWIFWDWDDVHTKPKCAPDKDFNKVWPNIYARTACALFKGLEYERARHIGLASVNAHGTSVPGLSQLAPEFGMEVETAALHIFYEVHRQAYELSQKEYPGLAASCAKTADAFNQLNGSANHSLVTHCSLDYWALRHMENNQLRRHFDNDHAHVELPHVGFDRPKSLDPAMIETGVERAGIDPAQALFVDDSSRNLKVAKERFPQMGTFLCTDEPPHAREAHIDLAVNSPLVAVVAVLKAKLGNPLRDQYYMADEHSI